MRKLRFFYQGFILVLIACWTLVFQVPPRVQAESIIGARWNADATQLLTWADDGARLWDSQTGNMLLRLWDGGSRIHEARWNADETHLLTRSNNRIYSWDAQTGERLVGIASRAIEGAVWNADATRVLAWTSTSPLYLGVWGMTGGEQIFNIAPATVLIDAQWSPDGTQILILASDSTLQILDATSGETRLSWEYTDLEAANWSPDGSKIVAWRYGSVDVWDSATGKYTFSLELNYDTYITDVQWNHDSSQILVLAQSSIVQVWDAKTGKSVHRLRMQVEVNGASWSPDATQIVTWTQGTVQIWDTATGEPFQTFYASDTTVGLRWKDDGTQIVTWTDAGLIRVWDIATGKPLASFNHDDIVFDVQWSHDASQLLSVANDETARVWEIATPETALLTVTHNHAIQGTWLSPDNRYVATWADDGNFRVWNVASGALLYDAGLIDSIKSLKWSEDSTQLGVTESYRVWLWDITNQERRDISAGLIQDSIWNDDGSLLTWSGNRIIQFWDTQTGEKALTLTLSLPVKDAQWNHTQTHLLTWTADGTIQLWHIASATSQFEISTGGTIYEIYWNEEASAVMTVLMDSTIQVWSYADGTPRQTLNAPLPEGVEYVDMVAWNATATQLVRRLDYRHFEIWDIATGELQATFAPNDLYFAPQWNLDGTRILTWENSGISIWDAQTGRQVLYLENYQSGIEGATWSADGTRILSFGTGIPAQIWDARTGKMLLILPHRDYVYGTTWNAAETQLITWTDSGAEFWDATTGQLLLHLEGSANWSPDETYIVSSGDTVQILDTQTGELLQTFSHWTNQP